MLKRYPSIRLELHLLEKHGDLPALQAQLRQQKEEVEASVAAIEDPTERMLIYLRDMCGLSWQQVAGQMEGRFSRDYLRQLYRDTLKKYF